MRVAWLLLPALAALALTVPTGCCRVARHPPTRTKAPEGRVHQALAQVKKLLVGAPAEAPAADDKIVASWEVKGWGRNQAEAEQNALDKARVLLITHLRQQDPPLGWGPSTVYIRKHLVSGPASRHKGEDQPVGGIQTECWSLAVQLTAGQYREMVKLDREYGARLRQIARARHAEQRMWTAAGVTGGILLLVVIVGGFLRLDDWSGGAYTKRLRAGLRCVLSVPGTGLRKLTGDKCSRAGPRA